MRVAIVKASHDDEASVWYVEHSDVEGLHVEGESFETFCDNVASAVEDLLEGEGGEFTLKSLRTPRCAPASPREVSNRLLRRRFTI